MIWVKMSKQGLKLSEQLSAVESKCNSLNVVIKHAWGWEGYIAPLLMLVTDGLGSGGGTKSNGREQGQSNESKTILLTLHDCPAYPVCHQRD